MIKLIPTPYNFYESVSCLLRMIIGPSRKNPSDVKFIEKQCCLNAVKKKVTIGFLGDIMGLTSRTLQIDPELKNFISGCDAIVGNFETTISRQNLAGLKWKHFSWKQDESIIDALKQLTDPGRLYLSIANNHSGDFAENGCRASAGLLVHEGIHVFGFKETPYMDISPHIRIWTGTMWSNMNCDHVAQFADLEAAGLSRNTAAPPGAETDGRLFHICFPHWGYEMELYPRPSIVDLGRSLLARYDMVIGHHPHVPQPVTVQKVNAVNKLLAYSLGDFSFGSNIDQFLYGVVITVDIGPNSEGRWLAGNVNWSFTKCVILNEKEAKVSLIGRTAFHPEP